MNIKKLLTPSEYKIAKEVSLGLSEKEIGVKLFVSVKTVHNHTYNIRKKLKARNAVDIARKFILSLEDPKRYFAALCFLIIQLFIVFNSYGNLQVRRLPKLTFRVRNTKILRTETLI